jgi:hypothetical protein
MWVTAGINDLFSDLVELQHKSNITILLEQLGYKVALDKISR